MRLQITLSKSLAGKRRKGGSEALQRLRIKEVYILSILIGSGDIARRQEALEDIRARG